LVLDSRIGPVGCRESTFPFLSLFFGYRRFDMSNDDETSASDQIADRLETAANKVASAVERAVGSVRQATNAALDKVEAGAQSAREGGRPTFDKVAERAQRLAAQGRAAAAQAQQQAGEKLREYADKTSAYVAQKPLQSVAIAAGIGAALAWLLGRKRK
jgi:ElaB/YqjD/DUF883 family membrane-anchored ribosome-binding protein